MYNRRSCVVIGAGVVGLSTALCLQEKGYRVTIVADKFGADTISHVAGGIFLPYNRDVLGKNRRSEAIDVVKRSWNHYKRLHDSSEETHGVTLSFGYQCYYTKERHGEPLPDTPLLWETAEVYRSLSVEELKKMSPDSPCSGWIIQTYIIQCLYYLPYLMKLFVKQGGKVIEKHLNSFDEVPECDVVINCCGLGASNLCNDTDVIPAQGQVAHVHATHIKHFFHCEEVYYKPPEERQLLYYLPHTNHVVVGGTFAEHDSSILAKEDVREEFMRKLCHVAPSLKNSAIIQEKCGLRPVRHVLRLESEKITLSTGKMLQVVHNYGHGGNGIALSWGTSELAAEMVERQLSFHSKL